MIQRGLAVGKPSLRCNIFETKITQFYNIVVMKM